MRERLRILLAACFYYSGFIGLAHWWARGFNRRLIILNYHRAAGDNLRRQMLYLRRHYRIMHLEAALEEFYAHRHPRRASRDRRLPLVLTFDDGYLDNYTRGLQLARELQVPITLLLIPGYVEDGNYLWCLAGEFLVSHAQVDTVTIEKETYHLGRPDERQALLQMIDRRVRYAESVAEREEFLQYLQYALEISLPKRGSAHDDDALPLTWSEIHEMEESGWVSFGAHTMHHPILAHLSHPIEIKYEVAECRRILEQQLGHPVRTFAYPIGKWKHIGEEGLQAVKEAGYEWALTTIEETNTAQTHPLLLRRLPGDLDQHWLVQAAELVGLLGWSRFRKKA